jgi:hypothetical protein
MAKTRVYTRKYQYTHNKKKGLYGGHCEDDIKQKKIDESKGTMS